MSKLVTVERWTQAQGHEGYYWRMRTSAVSLLDIAAHLAAIPELLGEQLCAALFEEKDVLEVGVGPLGLSLASFYTDKQRIARLVKLEPLSQLPISDTRAWDEQWAASVVSWMYDLSREGEYVQCAAESMQYREEFDTVITHNVLDHVQDPGTVLARSFDALRPGGRILVGVDCRSVLGYAKFEYVLRRMRKDSFIVQAHPHSFLPAHVLRMLRDCGFIDANVIRLPGLAHQLTGSAYRSFFTARRPK